MIKEVTKIKKYLRSLIVDIENGSTSIKSDDFKKGAIEGCRKAIYFINKFGKTSDLGKLSAKLQDELTLTEIEGSVTCPENRFYHGYCAVFNRTIDEVYKVINNE